MPDSHPSKCSPFPCLSALKRRAFPVFQPIDRGTFNCHALPLIMSYHPTSSDTPVQMPPTVKSRRVWRKLIGVDVDGSLLRRQGVEGFPHLHDAGSPGRKHAVLQGVEVLTVDRRDETARDKAEQNPGREIVLPDAVAHLEILVKHCGEGERNWLHRVSRVRKGGREGQRTLSEMTEVGGLEEAGLDNLELTLSLSWVSRSSKRMPPNDC